MSAPQDPMFQAPPPPPMTDAEPVGPRATDLRPFAIAAFVLGVIFAVGGAAKFLPGGIGTGAALCFLGIVWFAISAPWKSELFRWIPSPGSKSLPCPCAEPAPLRPSATITSAD